MHRHGHRHRHGPHGAPPLSPGMRNVHFVCDLRRRPRKKAPFCQSVVCLSQDSLKTPSFSPPSDHFFFAWLGASNAGSPRLAACPFSAQRPFRCARPRAVATGSCATSPPPPLHENFMNKRMSFCATWVGEGVVRELSHTCPGARVLPTAVYACMPCMCVCACIHACYAYMFSTTCSLTTVSFL